MHRINPGWVATVTFCLLAILTVASEAGAGKVEYVEEVTRNIAVDTDVRFVFTNTSGETEITSWDKDEIRIAARKVAHARSLDEAKEYARDLKVDIRTEGTHLVIVDTRFPEWGGGGGVLDLILSRSATGEVNYEITVPERAQVVISSSSGDVIAEDMGGELSVSVTSGDVEVTRMKGVLAVATTSGDVDVSDVRGNTRVSATTGDVTVIDVDGEVEVGVTSGDIYCQKIEGPMEVGGSSSMVSVVDCVGHLEIYTSDGDIKVDDHRGGVFVKTVEGYVEVEINALDGGECDINASSGDIDLRISDTGSYKFVIETVSGEVEMEMPEEMEVTAAKNLVNAIYRGGQQLVRVATITGDIYIEGH
jgi:hypothetical protein